MFFDFDRMFQCLTCVLSKLVHRLQVDDVRRKLSINLSQDHTPPSIPLQNILYVVTNRRTVRPPAPMFVQPFPDHHPGHTLWGVPHPVHGHQQPRPRTCHHSSWCLSRWLCPKLEHHCSPASQLTHWSIFVGPPDRKKLESASVGSPQLGHVAAFKRAVVFDSSSAGTF